VTIQVKLSDLLRVGISAQLFHDEMRNWRRHMEFVEADKRFPLQRPDRSTFDSAESFDAAIKRYDAAMLQQHTPYPGPHQDYRFSHVITDDAEPFYVIIDDAN
jgi:hypothetical protein